MSQIQPIEETSVQRIVAGQAVTDLASAVKELVDNALDAKSKTINIRLFNQGIDIVEVTDDGCGIPPASRPYIATPHATSKIRSFSDIYQGSDPLTMGFRGEALFCLANLSAQLLVATRTDQEESAKRLSFRKDGSLDLASVSDVPRKVGTTVAVVRLMEAIPVRRADMIRRISRQRMRLMKLMEGYAIFAVGVHLTLMDVSSKDTNVLLETPANTSSVQETISAIKGSRFLASLCPLCIDLSSIVGGNSDSSQVAAAGETAPKWKVEGFISKTLQTRDRGLKDGQYFSINGRPVELPKVSRILNDIWRNFGTKKPSCVLQFTLPNDAFDINLAPDKRQVMLTQEQEICAAIQDSVSKLWASQTEGKFTANSIGGGEGPKPQTTNDAYDSSSDEDVCASPNRFSRRYAFSHDLSKARLQHEYDDGRRLRRSSRRDAEADLPPPPPPREDDAPPMPQVLAMTEEKKVDGEQHADMRDHPATVRKKTSTGEKFMDASDKQTSESVTPLTEHAIPTVTVEKGSSSLDQRPSDAERRQWHSTLRTFNRAGSTSLDEEIQQAQRKAMGFDQFRASGIGAPALSHSVSASTSSSSQGLERFGFQVTPREQSIITSQTSTTKRSASSTDTEDAQPVPKRRNQGRADCEVSTTETIEAGQVQEQKTDDEHESVQLEQAPSTVWTAFQGTDAVIEAAHRERLAMRDRKRNFREMMSQNAASPIDLQQDGSNAELSLPEASSNGDTATISLSKQDFSDMTVIGQFNMGFILARSRDNHLWVLDQHACDEKYNFERLCKDTVIHEQQLIAPMPLELSPAEEMCVLDHWDIFEKNGFRFAYDPDKPPRHRFALTALPHSGASGGRKAVQFGKDDVSALCTILGVDGSASSDGAAGSGTGVDGSGMYGNNAVRRYTSAGAGAAGDTADKVIARLPKAIAMFASRACRSSIMIGKALSPKEMDRIVKRLQGVDHPWNCPHGRPTMRHVGDMSSLMMEDETKAAQHIAGPTVTVMTQQNGEPALEN